MGALLDLADSVAPIVVNTPDSLQAEQLRFMIRAVAALEGWPSTEVKEAITAALADHEAALTCWRSIGREYGVTYPPPSAPDDRITCRTCANLTAVGHCLGVARGELRGAGRGYHPAQVLRRCEAFAPLPSDPDRRPGTERWPSLTTTAHPDCS